MGFTLEYPEENADVCPEPATLDPSYEYVGVLEPVPTSLVYRPQDSTHPRDLPALATAAAGAPAAMAPGPDAGELDTAVASGLAAVLQAHVPSGPAFRYTVTTSAAVLAEMCARTSRERTRRMLRK